LYSSGLRIGEVVRLDVRDYDPHAGTLLILQTKFEKTRLVLFRVRADGLRLGSQPGGSARLAADGVTPRWIRPDGVGAADAAMRHKVAKGGLAR
jgi:integrase